MFLRDGQEISDADSRDRPARRLWQDASHIWADASVLRGLICFVVLPNLIRYALRTATGFGNRGLVDLDVLLLWPLLIVWPRNLVRAFATLLLVIDFVTRLCLSYYLSPMDLLLAIPTAPLLRWRDFAGTLSLSLFLFAAFFFLFGAIYPGRPKRRIPVIAWTGLLLIALSAEKTLAGFGPLRASDAAQSSAWDLATSGVHAVYFLTVTAPKSLSAAEALKPVRSVPSASAPLFANPSLATRAARTVSLAPQPDLLLITVESLGLPQNPAMESFFYSLFNTDRIRDRFTVQTGTVPFFGATVSGQLRELCQSSIGLQILARPDANFSTCLPALLRKRGYQTEAVHNGSQRIFDREQWYPRIGFARSWFQEQLSEQEHLPNCESPFMGTCDDSVAGWIGERLVARQRAPLFIHWMTLDSHLPVVVSRKNLQEADCSLYSSTANATDVCAWFGSETHTLRSIATMLSRADLLPVEIIVVGDHAPPFRIESERLQFSQAAVPYIHLIPHIKRNGADLAVLSSVSLPEMKPSVTHGLHPRPRTVIR